jgi:hypothetical protein
MFHNDCSFFSMNLFTFALCFVSIFEPNKQRLISSQDVLKYNVQS